MWEMTKSSLANGEKLQLFRQFDEIMQLGFSFGEQPTVLSDEMQALLDERATARANKDWQKADALRERLQALGHQVVDSK